jgi:hypothetical protein
MIELKNHGRAAVRTVMDKSRLPWWLQSKIAVLEEELGRAMTPGDWGHIDINKKAQTITVAGDPLLAEIRCHELTRDRGFDLPPNPA